MSKDCVSDLMMIAKVNEGVIDRFIMNSGGTKKDNDNIFMGLETEI